MLFCLPAVLQGGLLHIDGEFHNKYRLNIFITQDEYQHLKKN